MPAPRFTFRSAVLIPIGPVFDGDFFPRPLDELRAEAPNKRFIAGVTQFEGLLFCMLTAALIYTLKISCQFFFQLPAL